jgi:nitrite reductase/ring-hydroxylating ferredoxin subunit
VVPDEHSKGSEYKMATTAAFRTLDDAGKLPDNYVNPYYLEDLKRRVSVARTGGKLYAFDDLCKHEGCPLSSGLLTGTTLMCQCHGSQYDITSGAVLRGPATEPLATYEVRERTGKIQVRV